MKEKVLSTQIGILVPIESQGRTNGTTETGSSIKHLKAVLSKTKKAHSNWFLGTHYRYHCPES
jgi:hypothetical protein